MYSNSAKFNQYSVYPTCLLCGRALSVIRDLFIIKTICVLYDYLRLKNKKISVKTSTFLLAQLMIFVCYRFPVVLFGSPGISNCQTTRPRLRFFIVSKRDLFVYRDDSLTS